MDFVCVRAETTPNKIDSESVGLCLIMLRFSCRRCVVTQCTECPYRRWRVAGQFLAESRCFLSRQIQQLDRSDSDASPRAWVFGTGAETLPVGSHRGQSRWFPMPSCFKSLRTSARSFCVCIFLKRDGLFECAYCNGFVLGCIMFTGLVGNDISPFLLLAVLGIWCIYSASKGFCICTWEYLSCCYNRGLKICR